jgi:nucleoid-associated protein YgaU
VVSRSFLTLVAVLAVLIGAALWFFPWPQENSPEPAPRPEAGAGDTPEDTAARPTVEAPAQQPAPDVRDAERETPDLTETPVRTETPDPTTADAATGDATTETPEPVPQNRAADTSAGAEGGIERDAAGGAPDQEPARESAQTTEPSAERTAEQTAEERASEEPVDDPTHADGDGRQPELPASEREPLVEAPLDAAEPTEDGGNEADDSEPAAPQLSAVPPAEETPEDTSAAAQDGEPEAAPPARGPSFDVVRVEPDGSSVMAGRASPDAEVIVSRDGQEVARGRADARGEFVLLPDRPLPAGDYALDLEERTADGTTRRSEDRVVLSVPEPEAAPASGAAADGPLVVQVPRAERGEPRVMQLPEPRPDGTAGGLWLEAVDYDPDGRVVVTGAGLPDRRVLAYLDNSLLGEATVDAEGRWRLAPQRVIPAGLYTLRIDQVADDGAVTARVESPFARAAFDTADLPEEERFVVIQPGNNLWTIARRTYGEGTRYTVIFDANDDQIGDPDLIYPGQIFVLPADRG